MFDIKVNLILGAIKLAGKLTLSQAHSVGSVVGTMIWLLNTRMCRITRANLSACYPRLTTQERNQLAKRSLQETSKTLLEVAIFWEWPVERCLSSVKEIEGSELIDNALQLRQGLILLAPHIGNWELAGLYMATKFDMAALFKPPKMKGLEPYMTKVRQKTGSELVPTNKKGVIRLFKILKEGGVVGILPDQDPTAAGGVYAPFFGIQTNTMKLVSKLIEKTHAKVLITCAVRLDKGAGFRLVVKQIDPDIYSDDLLTSVTGMNRSVQAAVMEIPEQYQWEYKRFKRRPDGLPYLYYKGKIGKRSNGPDLTVGKMAS